MLAENLVSLECDLRAIVYSRFDLRGVPSLGPNLLRRSLGMCAPGAKNDPLVPSSAERPFTLSLARQPPSSDHTSTHRLHGEPTGGGAWIPL